MSEEANNEIKRIQDLNEQFVANEYLSQAEFELNFKIYCDNAYCLFSIRTSKPNQDPDTKQIFPTRKVTYRCIHYGTPRSNIKDGSRPKTKTGRKTEN
jgi:hypothetical protein